MKIITAPEKLEFGYRGYTKVFLAGGITGCTDWQQEVIGYLKEKPETSTLMVANPRRKVWNPNADENEIRNQILWEADWIKYCDIFSMYFAGGESMQPICMYELGRTLCVREDVPQSLLINCGPGYARELDVKIQSDLALGLDIVKTNVTPKEHAEMIYNKYVQFRENPFRGKPKYENTPIYGK